MYRAGYGTPAEISAFLDGNPDWPDRALLAQRAEEALFRANATLREVKGFFAANPPRSAAGVAALACISSSRGKLRPPSRPEVPIRRACRRVMPSQLRRGLAPNGMNMVIPPEDAPISANPT